MGSVSVGNDVTMKASDTVGVLSRCSRPWLFRWFGWVRPVGMPPLHNVDQNLCSISAGSYERMPTSDNMNVLEQYIFEWLHGWICVCVPVCMTLLQDGGQVRCETCWLAAMATLRQVSRWLCCFDAALDGSIVVFVLVVMPFSGMTNAIVV